MEPASSASHCSLLACAISLPFVGLLAAMNGPIRLPCYSNLRSPGTLEEGQVHKVSECWSTANKSIDCMYLRVCLQNTRQCIPMSRSLKKQALVTADSHIPPVTGERFLRNSEM